MRRAGRARAATAPLVAMSLGVVALAGAPYPASSGRQSRAVLLPVTVVDGEGRPVTGLTREDFALTEDGRRREVTAFSAAHQPVAAVLLLDMNGPPVEVPWLRDAALAFVDAMQPDDRVRLGTFGDEVFLSPRLTGERPYLHWVLQDELWPSSSSPLWQALDAAIASFDDSAERRTIVVLSNGYHRAPLRMRPVDAGDVLRRAERPDVAVHVVTFEDVELDPGLRRIAARTGGRLATMKDLSVAPTVLAEIVEELRRQYLVAFEPAQLDGERHEIEIRVTRPGTAVRARTHYRASRER